MKRIQNYIGGIFRDALSLKTIDNYEPRTGQIYGTLPDSNDADVALACQNAHEAFPAWKETPFENRAKILRKMGNLILEKKDELAEIESRDNGKPIKLSATLDIPRSATNFHFFADAIQNFNGECYQTHGNQNGPQSRNKNILSFTTHTPLGVVACISPWNLPLYLLTWKIAPALITGNTVVAKPSEITPMTAYYLAYIAHEAGLPPGVLNIIHGRGTDVGRPLVNHPLIRAVSFTGSTAVGKYINETCATSFKKVSLEMGGKNAAIILGDANLEKAIDTTIRSSFSNQGQICLCTSRILVERSIYNQVKEALCEKISQIKIGDPLAQDTQHGALVSANHLKKVLSYIEMAQKDGGSLFGMTAPTLPKELKDGYFLPPTLIDGLDSGHPINQEEIFGPVASLIPFDTIDEAINIANSTNYGLATSVWTQDINRAHHMSHALESGIVWINSWMIRDLRTPFGGIKDSGVGREGGLYALRFFTEVKTTCLNF